MKSTKTKLVQQLSNEFIVGKLEAGCDEAGRGCLAGPLVAAAVILPKDFNEPLLNDSKQLTEKQRKYLKPIIEQNALAFAVEFIHEREIERINILNASLEGMYRAVKRLNVIPEVILFDGNKLIKQTEFEAHCIIKGDAKIKSIAAASILAKTYRDEYMENLHLQFPQFAWNINKGYPTKKHRDAIKVYGTTEHHRLTFNLLGSEQLSLPFEP